MQMFVMWFIVDSKRDGDANNEKRPSGSPRPVYKSLSLLQPRKRIPKVVYSGFDLLQALLQFGFGGLSYFVEVCTSPFKAKYNLWFLRMTKRLKTMMPYTREDGKLVT